jgi:uncharacterized membrane protein YraQ (UPF0718 family)
MKKKTHFNTDYLIAGFFGCFVLLSHLLGFSAGQKMSLNFYQFSLKMVMLIPVIFIYIGLLDVWVPKEAIEKHIGEESGIKGVFYVLLLSFFQGGPLYVAFPMAHLLWKKGCSIRNIFVYIGSFSALKIPMFMFETSFLGWKFSLLRAAASLPVFLLIAEVMARHVRKRELPLTRM